MAFMTTVLAASLALTPGVSTLSTTNSTSPVEGTQHSAVTVIETFRAATGTGSGAVTYDPKSVPLGSHVEVRERTSDRGTWFELRLEGVQAERTFGAHVHRKPCGTDPATSGGHYQNVTDPVQPSVDPAYANKRNEAWLDLTTDAHGRARSQTSVRWWVRAGEARSVVVHEHATDTRPGHAGTAGARLACVNVSFL
ncbi:superoxide dismutase family protein [Streptomyces eurocidicus]|uniref:Cu-Zn family superoxide dismutase n=2 Tax=Streptomyces eurocidicus TaxID=66423 RepID=A0A7W8BBL2_STREU|nr:superoxide dismutase family protein [Streptomyces eurocidicus]MBB5119231.1 Cu-Zn family superoxide dismutase [Streptomyces eurocidicus]